MSTASLGAVAIYVRRLSAKDTRALPDRQLLDRFTRRRDEAAFAELVRRHGPMVLASCRRVLRHEQDAEDACQAAFLVLARKAGSIRRQDSLAGWLYQVAHRLALRARAAAGRRREQPIPAGDGFASPALPGHGVGASVHQELERLPEPYRSAVVLCYVEGRTQAEAARLLATTSGAVNSRLKRARDLLRQRFVRRGLVLSTAPVSDLALGPAQAALAPALVRLTARTALQFTTSGAPACAASTAAAALAKGALHTMFTPKLNVLAALALCLLMVITGSVLVASAARSEDPPAVAARDAKEPTPKVAAPTVPAKGKARPSCILLWMSGGPSQIDTFDPKPGDPNGALFGAIDTSVKGVKISQNLPRLAKLAHHLAIIRSLTHRQGDHMRGTYLMRTGYEHDNTTDYPSLACVLAKELGASRPDLPRYLCFNRPILGDLGFGPGFLGPQYGPLFVGGPGRFPAPPRPGEVPALPSAEEFDALAKGKGDAHRKAVGRAFDLTEEKAEVRGAYGPGHFGQACLVARRLVERGVPVVEVTMHGWDTHANALGAMPQLCAELDAGWTSLLKDLQQRELLDKTLVVWMGEFGRTPRINPNGGRDHWPLGFSVVLAGRGIKGGRVIGKTSADATQVEERPVSPQELLATIYQGLGIDPTRQNQANTGQPVRLVPAGTKAVAEALR